METNKTEQFKVVICGSRTFNNYNILKAFCDKILINKAKTHELVVISGNAKGADVLGERYAEEKGYKCSKYPANWDKHGKGAGFMRNDEMLKIADGVIAFSKAKSKGTEHMIQIAKQAGKGVRVYREA